MKHLLAIVFAIALAALGFYIVIVNAKGISTAHLIAGAVAIAFSLLLAIPAQAKDAFSTLASYAPLLKRGASTGAPT